ncbi:hypothetical protein [Paenibacillus sp. FSL H8-0079]|uniref:hypothetical protein n=1 Tax=Paenibacillus sp. FSL H8-0079 TaxID=2921375 RepID=UPI0030EB7899
MKNQGEVPFHHLSVDQFLHNYDQFIDNTYPDMKPTREVEHHVMTDILFDPSIRCTVQPLSCFRK